jgi:tRNA (mo5U34)-methyltransferase
MLHSGAAMVIGLDPFLLYVMQFEVLRRYAGSQSAHFVLPVGDDALDAVPPLFDIVVSMGVLYHHASPREHLQRLLSALKPGGTLVLETLIIRNAEPVVLEPHGRYAMMRNVFAIPSVPALLNWINEAGFNDARVVDVSTTTTDEQRRTDWMTFQSLADFLNPEDLTQTVEGHPAPVRAIVLATKHDVS